MKTLEHAEHCLKAPRKTRSENDPFDDKFRGPKLGLPRALGSLNRCRKMTTPQAHRLVPFGAPGSAKKGPKMDLLLGLPLLGEAHLCRPTCGSANIPSATRKETRGSSDKYWWLRPLRPRAHHPRSLGGWGLSLSVKVRRQGGREGRDWISVAPGLHYHLINFEYRSAFFMFFIFILFFKFSRRLANLNIFIFLFFLFPGFYRDGCFVVHSEGPT